MSKLAFGPFRSAINVRFDYHWRAWFVAGAVRFSRDCIYPKRGRANHLTSGNGKSHRRAMAVRYSLQMVLGMKTDTSRRVIKDVEPYVQLQRQMHDALLKQHPEWIQPNGESPICEAYESRLAELLGLSRHSEHRSAA